MSIASDIETAEMSAFLRATPAELFKALHDDQQDKLLQEWFNTLDREDVFNIVTMARQYDICTRAPRSWESFIERMDLHHVEPYASVARAAYGVE